MNLTLDYVRDRLLNAGSKLQHAIVHEDMPECVYDHVHDAQNQLALGLAALVQIEHDGVITAATKPVTVLYSTSDLVTALRKEARATLPTGPEGTKKYTHSESNKLLSAAAVLESLHPSLFNS